MSAVWVKITSAMLLFVFPSAGMAAEAAGMVRGSGTVKIDGRACCQSTDVGFDGQTIATGANSNAVITSRGTVISMSSNTSVILGQKGNELIDGLVVISSDRANATRIDDLTISIPAGGRGKFVAKLDHDELQLLALEGRVELTDGQQQTEPVPATTGVKIKLPKRSKEPKESRKTAGGRSWLNNDDIGILIVVAAAVSAGVALGIVNSQNAAPATPTAP